MAAVISATDTEVTLPVNAIFQQTFLRQATPLCPYLAGTKPAEVIKHGGAKTAKWRRVGSITPSTSSLSEQTGNAAYFGGRDAVAVSNTDVTATLAKYGQIVALTEEVEAFNPNQQIDEIVKAVGIVAGRSLNMLQRDVVDDNATVVYAGGAASVGALVSKITKAAIDSVVNTLVRNSAMPFTPMAKGDTNTGTTPVLPAFWGLCHPDVAYDITQLSGFKSVETYAGQVKVAPGEFGMISSAGFGVRFIQSQDATVDLDSGGTKGSTGLRGSTEIDVYTTAIYGMDALGSVGLGKNHGDGIFTAEGVDALPQSIEIIVKGFGSGGTSDPLNELKTIAYKMWHGGTVLNTNWARVIKSGATSL